MNCRKIQRLLPLHVGGDLETGIASEVEGHLATCESCREDLRTYETSRRSLFALKGDPETRAPDLWPAVRLRLGKPPATRRWRPVLAAAAAVLFLAAGATGLILTAGSGETPKDVAKPPPVTSETSPAPVAAPPKPSLPPIVVPGPGSFLLAEVGSGTDGVTFDSDSFPSVETARPERTGWDEF